MLPNAFQCILYVFVYSLSCISICYHTCVNVFQCLFKTFSILLNVVLSLSIHIQCFPMIVQCFPMLFNASLWFPSLFIFCLHFVNAIASFYDLSYVFPIVPSCLGVLFKASKHLCKGNEQIKHMCFGCWPSVQVTRSQCLYHRSPLHQWPISPYWIKRWSHRDFLW